MRRLAYLFLSLIITVCVMRELAYNLEITKPHQEGFLGILYDWAFYGQGDLIYNYINWIGAVGAICIVGIMRQVGTLATGRIDPSQLEGIPHVNSEEAGETVFFKVAFPKAKIKET